MQINSPNRKLLSPEEIRHLEKLKSVVERALDDGKLSTFEIARIKFLVMEKRTITYEALLTIRQTTKAVMGDTEPEMEWEVYK